MRKFLLLFIFLIGRLIANGTEESDTKNPIILSDYQLELYNLSKLMLDNGEVFIPRHDGVNHFIPNLINNEEGGVPPTKYAIDEAAKNGTIIDLSNVSSPSIGVSDLTKLPITLRVSKPSDIDGQLAHYDITILAMVYKPDGVYFDIGCKFVVPDLLADNQKKVLYFGTSGFKMPYQGGSLTGKLQLIEAPPFTFKNWEFMLGPRTELTFNCGKFEEFALDLMVGIDRNLIVPEDVQGKPLVSNAKFTILGYTKVKGWNDIIVQLEAPTNIGFHPADMPEVGFWFGNPNSTTNTTKISSIILDLSEASNHPQLKSIACFSNPTWKGIYIQNLFMRTPSFIKSRTNIGQKIVAGVQDFIIGNHGIYGTAIYSDSNGIISLEDGQVGEGWDASLNEISFGKTCNGGYTFSMKGRVRPPILKTDESFLYEVTYTNSVFSFTVDIPSTFTADVFKGDFDVSPTKANLSIIKGEVNGTILITGCLKIADLNEKMELYLKVNNFGLTTTKPFIKSPDGISVTSSCSSSSGEQHKFQVAGFTVSITKGPTKEIADDAGKVTMSLGVAVALGADDNQSQGSSLNTNDGSFYAEGLFSLKGELVSGKRYTMNNLSIGLNQLNIAANFKVFSLTGSVNVFRNDPTYETGFKGQINLKIKLDGDADAGKTIDGSLTIYFGRKTSFGQSYKYWFFDAGVTIDQGIDIGGGLTLKGLNGGAYKNMAMVASFLPTGSGFKYVPNPGGWGFKAGVKLGVTGDVPVDIKGMLEIVGANDGTHRGIKTVYLIADVDFNLDKKLPSSLKEQVMSAYKDYESHKTAFTTPVAKLGDKVVKFIAPDYKNATEGATKEFEPTTANSTFRVGASMTIWYSVDELTLTGILYPKVSIKIGNLAQANSTGYGVIHFSPTSKYIHLGKSEWEDRLGLTFTMPGISATANAYYMLGDGISDIPKPRIGGNFQSLFDNTGVARDPYSGGNKPDFSEVKMGKKGMAFGAAIAVSFDIGIPIVANVSADAGAGFDFVLREYTTDACIKGWNGWYGKSQLYGYAEVGFKVLLVDIAKLGLGFSLKVNAPNPTGAEGRVKFFVKVWRSKLDLQAKLKIGTFCDIPIETSDSIVLNAVKSIYPTESPTMADVPTATKIKITLNELEDFQKGTSQSYSPSIENFVLVPSNGGTPVSGTLSAIYQENGEDIIDFIPNELLLKNTTYSLSFEVKLKDNNGVFVKVSSTSNEDLVEKKALTFTTSSSLKISPISINAVPYRDQYNTYRADESPYIKVNSQIANLVKAECPTCLFQLEIWPKGAVSAISNIAINDLGSQQSFSLESAKNDQIYELVISTTIGGVVQRVYDKHYFRMSRYNSFSEKITAIDNNKTTTQLTNGYPYFLVSEDNNPYEGFSKFELENQIQIQGQTAQWFDEFNNIGTYWNTTRLKNIVSYQQPYIINFSNGVVYETKTAVLKPQWEYTPINQASLGYYKNRYELCIDKELPDCPPIPPFYSGTYDILLNYTSASNANSSGTIHLQNTDDIILDGLTFVKRIFNLTCIRNNYDSQPLSLKWSVLKSDAEPVPFAVEESMDLKIDMGQIYTLTKNISKGQTNGEFGAFTSKVGCPTIDQTQLLKGKSGFYDLRISVLPPVPPNFKPVIVSTCNTYTTQDADGFDITTTYIRLGVYEDVNLFRSQTLRTPIDVKMSNGTTVTIPANVEYLDIFLNEGEACYEIDNSNTAFIIGDPNMFNPTIYLFDFSVSMKENTQDGVCKLNSFGESIFLPDNQLIKGASTSLSQGRIKNSPADGFYKVAPNASGESQWIQIIDGKIVEMGVCGSIPPPCTSTIAPPVITAISNTTIDFGATIQLQATGCAGIVRWTGEEQTGNTVSFTPAVSKRYAATCDVAGCTLSAPSNMIDVVVRNAISLSSSSPTNTVCALQPITLLSTGCAGTMSWFSDSQGSFSGTSVTITPTATTIFKTSCSVGGISLRGPAITVNVIALPQPPQISSRGAISYVCINSNTVVLEATGCTNQTNWSFNSLRGNSITINPTITQNYTAQCVSPEGCSSIASNNLMIEVINLPKPSISTTAYQSSICTNQQANLSASGCTTSVMWSNHSTGTNITPALASTTKFTAYCEDRGCAGLPSNELTIHVLSSVDVPTATAEKTDICAGTSTTINVTGNYIGKLEWSTGAGDVRTITISETGTYKVRASLNANCYSQWNSFDIIKRDLPPSPSLSSDKSNNTMCHGNTMSLTASVVSPHTIYWNSFNSTQSSIDVSPSPGKYSYYAISKSPYNCESPVSQIDIIVNAIPSAPTFRFDKNPICNYENTNLYAEGCKGTLHWEHDSNLTSNTILNAQPVTYKISCEVNGCVSSVASSPELVVYARPDIPILGGGGEVCDGDSKQVTATATGSIVWSNDKTESAINVTAGSYTAYTIVNGCRSLDAEPVVVTNKHRPAVPTNIHADKTLLCYDEKTTLRADVESGATLTWSNQQTGNPSVGEGTYTAKSSLNGCESSFSIQAVKIEAYRRVAPKIYADKYSVCGNNTTTLRTTEGSVKWYLGDSYLGEGNTLTAGKNTGYRARYEENGCTTGWSGNVDIKEATPLEKPWIYYTTPITLCGDATKSIEIRNVPTGATIYWSNNSNASQQNVGAGTYTVYAEKDGCVSPVSDGVTFTKISIPAVPTVVASPTDILEGHNTAITVTGDGTSTVILMKDGVFVTSGTNVYHSTGDLGSYNARAVVGTCESPVSDPPVVVKRAAPACQLATPTITGPDFVCQGVLATLQANSTDAGVTFEWARQGENYNPPPTGATLKTTPGTYKIRAYKDGCGYSSWSLDKVVQYAQKPAIPTNLRSTGQGQGWFLTADGYNTALIWYRQNENSCDYLYQAAYPDNSYPAGIYKARAQVNECNSDLSIEKILLGVSTNSNCDN